jgi:tetratricopeptide (TPR) repeat protein
VSEHHQKAAAHPSSHKTEAHDDEHARQPAERTRIRNQRLEAVKAQVADAAALRSKMIEAMRRKLEAEARVQAGGAGGAQSRGRPVESYSLVPVEVPPQRLEESAPDPAVYPLVRRAGSLPDDTPASPEPASAEPASVGDELDSIFAPVSVLRPQRPEFRASPPGTLAAGAPEIWDDALDSAQRVENALARLKEALARDESYDRRPPKTGRARSVPTARPRPLRVATLFAASFMIGISATIFAYDWYSQTSVEDRLAALVGQFLPAKPAAVAASNQIAVPTVKSAEKPLAAAGALRRAKALATVKLETFDAQGSADADIPLSIRALGGSDEQLLDIRLAGLPREAALSSGRRQADGSWLVGRDDQSGLTLRVPPEASGNLKLMVEAWEEKTGELAAPPQEITVKIAPARMVVEPAASPIAPVSNTRDASQPLASPKPLAAPEPSPAPELLAAPKQALAAVPPSPALELAAIEEAAEAPAMALGIDDPSRPLMARGDALMELGDVASARSFYDRAFDLGNTRAARSVARTYDPLVLATMNVQGLRSDPARALEWYRRAEKAGEPDAAQSIAALETLLGR